jgi:hypothetical protein
MAGTSRSRVTPSPATAARCADVEHAAIEADAPVGVTIEVLEKAFEGGAARVAFALAPRHCSGEMREVLYVDNPGCVTPSLEERALRGDQALAVAREGEQLVVGTLTMLQLFTSDTPDSREVVAAAPLDRAAICARYGPAARSEALVAVRIVPALTHADFVEMAGALRSCGWEDILAARAP